MSVNTTITQCLHKNYLLRLKAEKEMQLYKRKYEVLEVELKKLLLKNHDQEKYKETYFNFLYNKFEESRKKEDKLLIQKISNLENAFYQEIILLKELTKSLVEKTDQQITDCDNSFRRIEEKEGHIFFNFNEKIEHLNKEIIELKTKLDEINIKVSEDTKDISFENLQCENFHKDGTKDIFEAAKKGSLKAVMFYINEDRERLNQRESFFDNWTPLHYASFNKHLDVVKYLLLKGAEIDPLSSSCFYTPLHYASFFGHLTIIDFLISKGANINQQDCYNNTPLHLAALHGHIEVVKLLIVRGSDKNAKNKDLKTPLDCALLRNHFLITQYLSSLNNSPIKLN